MIAIDSSIDNCIGKLKTNDLNDWKGFVNQEVSKIIRNSEKKQPFYKISIILKNKNVKDFHQNFQKQFVIVPNLTYEFSSKSKDAIIDENISIF